MLARIYASERVVDRIAGFEQEAQLPATAIQRVRVYFEDRLGGLREQLSVETGQDDPEKPGDFLSLAEQRLWWELARVEREAILKLRSEQKIGDEAMREIEREIDLLEARLVPHSS